MAVRKIIEPGTKFTSKSGVEVEVVLYTTCTDVLVRRVEDGVEFKCTSANLKNGLVSGIQGSRGRPEKALELPAEAAWIAGMEGDYAITVCGKVLSFKSGLRIRELKGGVLSGQGTNKDKLSYQVVCLTQNGINKTYYVHRLVAEAFLENPEGKSEVNHIDGVKTNNKLSNLEWATSSENRVHAYDTGLQDASTRSYKASKGDYDVRITQALESGTMTRDLRFILDSLTDEELTSRGFDAVKVRSIKANPRATNYPTEKLLEMQASGMSLTQIAKITGYSLSGVSRKVNGSRN